MSDFNTICSCEIAYLRPAADVCFFFALFSRGYNLVLPKLLIAALKPETTFHIPMLQIIY